MNNRPAIRDAIEARLLGITIGTETVQIFKQRVVPPDERPSINIFTDGGPSKKTEDEQANRREERVQIEVYVEGVEQHQIKDSGKIAVEVQLDTLVGKVEEIFGKDYESLNALVDRLNYEGDSLNFYGEGETVISKILGEGIIHYVAIVFEQLENTV